MTIWLWLLERSAGDLDLRRKIHDQPSKSRVFPNHTSEEDVGEHGQANVVATSKKDIGHKMIPWL